MDKAPGTLDKIQITRLKTACLIGIHKFERTQKQDVIADITLYADLSKAGRTDNIDDTIDYHALEIKVIEFIGESHFLLIEKLADNLARVCLEHPLVQRVVIRVEKPGAPVRAEAICLEISRERKDYE